MIITNEKDMLNCGANLARICLPGTIVYLYGELGAGKTTFVRGFLRALGHSGIVKSPTYTLVESYSLKDKLIYHFDLYRLKDPHELEYMGIQDYFTPSSIVFIEWPENGLGLLPAPDLAYYMAYCSAGREIKMEAGSERGQQLLTALK